MKPPGLGLGLISTSDCLLSPAITYLTAEETLWYNRGLLSGASVLPPQAIPCKGE